MTSESVSPSGPTRIPEGEIIRLYPRLFRTALRLTQDADAASDATQQALVQALRRWGQFTGRSQVGTWLHRIVVNCVLDLRRARSSPPIP